MAGKKVIHYNAYIDLNTQRPVVEEIPGILRAGGRVHLTHAPHGDYSVDQTFPKVFLISSPESAVDDLCCNVRCRLNEYRTWATRLEEQLVHIVNLAQAMAASEAEEFQHE